MSRVQSLRPPSPPAPEERPERGRGFGSVDPLGKFQPRATSRIFARTPVVAGIVASVLGIISAKFVLTSHPKVAVAMFLSILAGFAILLEPAIGVLAYYNLAYMRPQETMWGLGNTRLTMMVSAATLAAALLHFALRPNLSFLWKKQTVFICLLWIFLHLSAHMNVLGTEQARWLDYYNKMFLIYFVTLALMNSERWLYALAWVTALSIGYLGLWANQQYFINGWATVHGPGTKGATYFDENGFAMILTMVIPFCWYLMLHVKHPILKAMFGTLLVLTAHGIMVTFSRGGFLGLACSGSVLLLRMRNKALALFVALLGLGGFVAVTGPRYVERMLSIGNYEEDKSATGRLDSWEVGFAMMKANPVFGVGFKRYVDEYHNYGKTYAREAHNSWVQLGAESGLIAVSSHIMLVLLTLTALLRVRKRLPYLPDESREKSEILVGMYEASLVGYLVTGFFLSMEDFEFFFMLVALAQVLDRVTEQRLAEVQASGTVLPDSVAV